jgi:hypothetical protein
MTPPFAFRCDECDRPSVALARFAGNPARYFLCRHHLLGGEVVAWSGLETPEALALIAELPPGRLVRDWPRPPRRIGVTCLLDESPRYIEVERDDDQPPAYLTRHYRFAAGGRAVRCGSAEPFDVSMTIPAGWPDPMRRDAR